MIRERLHFDYVMGGYGEVMRGKEKFDLWKEYFKDLIAETADAYTQGATLDGARRRVARGLEAKYSGKFPETFPKDVIANIEEAHRLVSGFEEQREKTPFSVVLNLTS